MVIVGLVLMSAGCLLAWKLGGPAERAGALALGGCWLASIALQGLLGFHSDVPIFIADVLYALALFALAARFDRSWIWISLVLQFADLAGHVLVIFLRGDDRLACIAFINVASFGTLLSLVLGAALHGWEARGRGKRGRRAATVSRSRA